jgi:hypothetical protein
MKFLAVTLTLAFLVSSAVWYASCAKPPTRAAGSRLVAWDEPKANQAWPMTMQTDKSVRAPLDAVCKDTESGMMTCSTRLPDDVTRIRLCRGDSCAEWMDVRTLRVSPR